MGAVGGRGGVRGLGRAARPGRLRCPRRVADRGCGGCHRSGAVAVGWRSQIAAAIEELADAGTVELPRTRWDTTSEPPLPVYVTRPPATSPATDANDPI